MPDNLDFPLDTDLVEAEGPTARKITHWWADAFRNYQTVLEGLVELVAGLSPGLFNSYVTDGVTTGDAGTVLSGGTSSLLSPVAAPNPGDMWTAYLTQPSAGNELVDLTGIVPDVQGLSINGAGTINNVSRGANKVTALSFICRADGDWWLSAVMVLS